MHQRLTPAQVRFGRMLEMSVPEFEDEVRRAVDENPALEAADNSFAADAYPQSAFNESAEELQRADYAGPDDIPSYRLNTPRDYSAPAVPDFNTPDESESDTLRLDRQVDMLDLDPDERLIATYIIGNIDDNGYLSRTPAAIADDLAIAEGIDVTTADVEKVMDAIRTLDPPGICATDLRDCLLLQLDRMPRSRAVDDATTILRDHFNLFSKKHFDRVAARMEIQRPRFDEALHVITSLNPKPGAQLEPSGAADRLRHISPDFIIDDDTDGHTTVTLAGHTPALKIESTFATDSPAAGASSAARTFIAARRDEAGEFIDMVTRRANTLMAVMNAIIALQPEFFATYDRSLLRPMVLRDIRDITGLDLSVISRATASKYAMTPNGIVSLKSLFSERVSDDNTSAHAVSEAISALIRDEDKTRPLSDTELADALTARGLNVARRTVAKYRERLGFPVARLRRN